MVLGFIYFRLKTKRYTLLRIYVSCTIKRTNKFFITYGKDIVHVTIFELMTICSQSGIEFQKIKSKVKRNKEIHRPLSLFICSRLVSLYIINPLVVYGSSITDVTLYSNVSPISLPFRIYSKRIWLVNDKDNYVNDLSYTIYKLYIHTHTHTYSP